MPTKVRGKRQNTKGPDGGREGGGREGGMWEKAKMGGGGGKTTAKRDESGR